MHARVPRRQLLLEDGVFGYGYRVHVVRVPGEEVTGVAVIKGTHEALQQVNRVHVLRVDGRSKGRRLSLGPRRRSWKGLRLGGGHGRGAIVVEVIVDLDVTLVGKLVHSGVSDAPQELQGGPQDSSVFVALHCLAHRRAAERVQALGGQSFDFLKVVRLHGVVKNFWVRVTRPDPKLAQGFQQDLHDWRLPSE